MHCDGRSHPPSRDEEEEEEEGPTPPTPRKGSTSLVELPRQDGATTFRQGWLARKVLAEAEGKKGESWGGVWGGYGGYGGIRGDMGGLGVLEM